MQILLKQLKSGFSLPVFGLGTWGMGGNHSVDTSHDKEDIQAIKRAIEAGITHIDTAESYAAGHTEELVAEAIQGYERSQLFIASKVKPEHFAYDQVLKAAENSLRRLQTDYIDLYYLHHPNPPGTSVGETMKAMDRLKEEGLIRNIAVSNHTTKQFEKAQAVTRNKIVANQLHLNLMYREPERKGLVDYCQTHDVLLVAWRPIQKGILTHPDNELLEQLCKKYHKTASQIAINWLISQKNIVTLSKMSTQEHLEENLGALDFVLSEEDIIRLDKEFPNQQDISDAVPLV